MAENASEGRKKKESTKEARRLLYNDNDDERSCLDGKKRKNKHVEQKESTKEARRLLYNDDERLCLDGKKRKNKHVEQKESTKEARRLLYNDDERLCLDGKKRKNKHVEQKESTKEARRLLYNDDERPCLDGKKRKNKHVEQKEPRPFSKVWSDEDEISILRGMIKFKEETGRNATQNMVDFHPFIVESLTLQATLVQLREKVRRLREKYEKSGNGSRTPHEEELFQLCEKIWKVHPKPNSSGTGQHNHNITGLNVKTLDALDERLRKDIELVLNSKACLPGAKWDVDLTSFDLYRRSFGFSLKLVTLVREKANSPELQNSPELLEQEVLRAYLEAKIEHTQLLSNAYNSFIKAPPKKVVASSSKNRVAAKKKDESGDDSSSEKDRRCKEEDHCDEA